MGCKKKGTRPEAPHVFPVFSRFNDIDSHAAVLPTVAGGQQCIQPYPDI